MMHRWSRRRQHLLETEEGCYQPVFFLLRKLKNLSQIDDVESLAPIMDMNVADLFEEETPQIFSVCGRGPKSSLRILRPGLVVKEMAVTRMEHGVPSTLWTVKKHADDEFDAYIVLSFANATLVLALYWRDCSRGNDSGFSGTTPSLAALYWVRTLSCKYIQVVFVIARPMGASMSEEHPG